MKFFEELLSIVYSVYWLKELCHDYMVLIRSLWKSITFKSACCPNASLMLNGSLSPPLGALANVLSGSLNGGCKHCHALPTRPPALQQDPMGIMFLTSWKLLGASWPDLLQVLTCINHWWQLGICSLCRDFLSSEGKSPQNGHRWQKTDMGL